MSRCWRGEGRNPWGKVTGILKEEVGMTKVLKGLLCLPRKQKIPETLRLLGNSVARQEGLEPPTFWFVAKHSIQLSYWRIGCSLTALLL